MIESFVDLTYRGLALGRRIKLTEVRPTTAFIELAAPMPVGTQLAIVTDDGHALDATVTWIREQVAGSDRPPGMVVAPALVVEAAAAWWQARVALPDDDQPRPRPSRSRPVTVRPRTTTERTRAVTDDAPTIIGAPPQPATEPDANGPIVPNGPNAPTGASPDIAADLQARVAAAAGLDLPPPSDRSEAITAELTPAEEPTRDAAPIRDSAQHDVVDDGKATMIMDAIDPATLGFDLPPGIDATPAAIGDEPSAPVITIEAEGEDADADADADDPDGAPGASPSEPSAGDKPSTSRGFKRRRKRR